MARSKIPEPARSSASSPAAAAAAATGGGGGGAAATTAGRSRAAGAGAGAGAASAERRATSARRSTMSAAAAAAAAAAAGGSSQQGGSSVPPSPTGHGYGHGHGGATRTRGGGRSTVTVPSGGDGNGSGGKDTGQSALVAALSYRGMEVLFTTSSSSSSSSSPDPDTTAAAAMTTTTTTTTTTEITGIFARTHAPFQTLDLPSGSARAGVVALSSNPTTGLVCAATADGLVHTYYPVETLPAHSTAAEGVGGGGGGGGGGGSGDGSGNGQDGGIPMTAPTPPVSAPALSPGNATSGGNTGGGVGGNASSRPVVAFGRYRWLTGRVVDCTDVFSVGRRTRDEEMGGGEAKQAHEEDKIPMVWFERRRPVIRTVVGDDAESNSKSTTPAGDNELSTSTPTSRHVTLSTSLDWKVLITYREQLAVFDVSPVDLVDGPVPGLDYGGAMPPTHAAFELSGIKTSSPTNLSAGGGSGSGSMPTGPESASASASAGGGGNGRGGGGGILLPPPATLLWTAKATDMIVTASISGNGRAIAYVVAKEGEGVPYPYGARTYVRDSHDGAASAAAVPAPADVSPSDSAEGHADAAAASSPSVPSRRLSPRKKNMNVSVSSDISNIGIIYKAGPFLNHSAPVTRVSFRGLGLNHSTVYPSSDLVSTEDGEEGNDLLLTCCQRDNSCRVFSQNSWKQLLQWTAPPSSRADWVQGTTAANLGDLDVAPARKKGGSGSRNGSRPGSSPSSRRPSGSSEGGGSAGINRHLLGQDGSSQPFPSLPAHPTPSSNAGAWISELTFRGGFPALRLSRLSYLKSGTDDAAPAHFESVAAILPPGTLSADAVLGGYCPSEEDYVMTVQGLWCAWEPWECGRGGSQIGSGDGDLAGSALALLGGAPSSSLSGGGLASLGTGNLGGSHAPPSELRIVSAHVVPGKVVVMEFPLWGDRELGAMELGSPLRYLLSLPGCEKRCIDANEAVPRPISALLEFESSHLDASVSDDGKSIALTWRKKGSMNVVPVAPSHALLSHHREDKATTHTLNRIPSLESIASTASLDSDLSHASFRTVEDFDDEEKGPRHFRDYSMAPLPLSLPPLLLPSLSSSSSSPQSLTSVPDAQGDLTEAVSWWPDKNFGGPPRLLALTKSGTVIVYEMPPPWSALEPPMPVYDPFSGSGGSSLASGFSTPAPVAAAAASRVEDESDDEGNGSDDESEREEYEVRLQPHSDFGIGLRLEAQALGMPAIAGSFKKHPLSGGRLPAERTGEITLGDELLAVNGVSLEGLSFDDIIAKVRDVGARARGGPLTMKFRPAMKRRQGSRAINSSASGLSSNGRDPRRSIFGSTSKEDGPTKADSPCDEKGGIDEVEEGNAQSVMVGADAEVQQEFGRIVAFIRNAIPSTNDSTATCRPMILLPWHYGVGAPGPSRVRAAAMIVTPEGRTVTASRLEVTDTCDVNPEGARLYNLGSLCLDDDSDLDISPRKTGGDNGEDDAACAPGIQSLAVVKTATAGWCLAVCDSRGVVSLVFIDIEGSSDTNTFRNDDAVEPSSHRENSDYSRFRAVFRKYKVFSCADRNLSTKDHVCGYHLQASSIDLIATMPKDGEQSEVTVWSALPQCTPTKRIGESEVTDSHYTSTTVSHCGSGHGDEFIVDFRWIASGSLDAFPWLVTFSSQSAVVHRRPGGQLRWIAVAELSYSSSFRSSDLFRLSGPSLSAAPKQRTPVSTITSPADYIPHLLSALRIVVTASDERDFLRSDWHPDSILASICTEEGGAHLGLKRSVKGLFRWLSLWMSPDAAARPLWNSQLPLGIAPFGAVNNEKITAADWEDASNSEEVESATALMASMSVSAKPTELHTEEDVLLFELQDALSSVQKTATPIKEVAPKKKVSEEFKLAMGAGAVIVGNDKVKKGERQIPIPDPLKKLSKDELRFLWAMGEVNQNPPKFHKLDKFAQLTAFCVALMQKIQLAELCEDEKKADVNTSSTKGHGSGRAFLVKRSSSIRNSQDQVKPPAIASAACLAALICDTQSELLASLRKPSEKMMDWPTARSLKIPFWLRSDDQLRMVAEEIAQDLFKKQRDVMECALYYIATRNMRSLRNFAAADQSDSGRMFFKFITQHDFSSQRGRKAAEKNAYSLLRKRRYAVAAGFFLLAEPPMLKSALEIIVTQMEDLSLAFMIARLVESSKSASAQGGPSSIGGLNLSAMGGGGGFASSGGGSVAGTNESTSRDIRFKDWAPEIGEGTRNLLTLRGLFMVDDDPFFEATQHLWLGQQNGAAMCLARVPVTDSDIVVPPVFHDAVKDRRKYACANDRVLAKANKIIDFSSAPILLKRMKTSDRTRSASAFLVARALSRRGIELSSLKTLLQATIVSGSGNDEDEKELAGKAASGNAPASEIVSGSMSIMKKVPESVASVQPVQSSIFDSFDAPPSRQKPPVTDVAAQSSIFDSFDAAPPKTKPPPPPPPAATSDMQSSIFDSFDAAPPKTKPPPPPPPAATSDMQSSIFDSFDAAPPKTKPPPPPPPAATSDMQSSIFDSFDAAPPKTKPPPPPPPASTGDMQSSIFDSFDAAPQKPKTSPPTAKPNVINQASAATSSSTEKIVTTPDVQQTVLELAVPFLWKEWRDNLLALTVARRLLREIARIAARFEGEVLVPPMKLFRRHVHPLITHDASHVLQYHCQGDAILSGAERCLREMTEMCSVDKAAVVEQALIILACPSQPRRIVFAVLLHCLMGRSDLAEDVIRNAAQDQIRKCESFAHANDDLLFNRKTRHHTSSQYIRRQASGVSLQLELCLWLHHGGVFAMCGMAAKECIIAVRAGYLVAGWGRCHESLETMLKSEPDCQMDHDMGRQLWSSMKIISSYDEVAPGTNGPSSGGWEFLVDCQRNEAAAMLRDTEPGTFLIRPHSEDHGVFSLSFRTNLTPTDESEEPPTEESSVPEKQPTAAAKADASSDMQHPPKPPTSPPRPTNARPVKKDDIVQHAIVRLSDSGFRCGSFGPFTSLIKLLEAVSSSLPFDLRFDQPPIQGIIKDQISAPSPNSVFIRKLALHSKTENYQWNKRTREDSIAKAMEAKTEDQADSKRPQGLVKNQALQRRFGAFSQLLALTEIRKQLSAVAAADFEDQLVAESSWHNDAQVTGSQLSTENRPNIGADDDFQEGLSEDSFDVGEEEIYAMASRILRPLLCWCRTLETALVHEIAPGLPHALQGESMPVDVDATETEVEVAPSDYGSCIDGGDAEIRRMIQPESGVEFRTLRVGEGNNSSVVVMFSRNEAVAWLVSSGAEKDESAATARLDKMERRRVIEQIDLSELAVGKSYGDSHNQERDIRYRFVDPWEVEVVETREGEVASATIGRGHYHTFNIGRVAKSCEQMQRNLGGLHLLALWSYAKGGICLTKALASVHPPWERDAGGDLQMMAGIIAEPAPFTNSIRQHLYRNMLFRRLKIPQRFLALLQVELLDLKNLTSPGGSSSLTAYALLRLKRPGSGAPLTHKARTLDSACTQPQKIVKMSGPNAPASWGSLVRLRFPLPEDVDCDGVSYDGDREALFKGAPSVLQVTVYEKKFMNDVALGGADVQLDALASGGQLEEWVPLRSTKEGITWFARIRLTLRFELMCLVEEESKGGEGCPSVGLTKIHALSKMGGAHEDAKGAKRSISSPDFVQYLESMVY